MSSGLAAAISGLVGLALGTALSETIRSTINALFRQGERRSAQAAAMRNVVLTIPSNLFDGYFDDFLGISVYGLRARLVLTNHSAQLVKNVRATMRRRPNGTNTAPMVPALPAGQSVPITINRELGIDDDRPFAEEEAPNWLDLFWFEVQFEDTHGNAWLLYYSPRDQKQTVERQSA